MVKGMRQIKKKQVLSNGELKKKVTQLEKSLRAAKSEIRTLKKVQTTQKGKHEEEIKNIIDSERTTYANQVISLTGMVKEINMGWSQNCSKLTTSLKGLSETLQSYLEPNIAEDQVGDLVKQLTNLKVPLDDITSVANQIQQIAVNGALPTCHKCKCELNKEENLIQPKTATAAPTEVPSCQICLTGFNDQPGQVPRILRCGHTLCESCATQIKRGGVLSCPFDRVETLLLCENAKFLSKNFSVLELCK